MLREVNEHLKPLPLASIFSSMWSQAFTWGKKKLNPSHGYLSNDTGFCSS